MNDRPHDAPTITFDRAIPATPRAGTALAEGALGVQCATCGAPIFVRYFAVNGEPLCDACRAKFDAKLADVSDAATVAKATFLGAFTALGGALLMWSASRFVASPGLWRAVALVATGWFIGRALRSGADGRGGRTLQWIGIALVYAALALAEFPFRYEVAMASGGSIASALALAIAQPFAEVFGDGMSGLLTGVIVAFAMAQAWFGVMPATAKVEGPLRIGPRSA